MLPPVAHRNYNESVDYIADTTLRFLSSVSTLFASGSTFKFIVVVINSQVSPRHVTVPVNLLCRTVIKHVVNVPIQHVLPLSVQPFALKSS